MSQGRLAQISRGRRAQMSWRASAILVRLGRRAGSNGDNARTLWEPLPATGRPPDLDFVADHFTVGGYFGRSGATVLLMGVDMSIAEEPYAASLPIGMVAEQSGTRQRDSSMAQGGFAAMRGHRKFGYFSGIITRFFDKFRAVYYSFVLRQDRPKPEHSGKRTSRIPSVSPDRPNATWSGWGSLCWPR